MSDLNLARHGTQAFALSPSSIIATAEADIARRAHNQHVHKMGEGGMQSYAFHREHVRQATSASDLIFRAVRDPLRGQYSKKRATVILYRDHAALQAALNATVTEPA